MPGGPDEWDAVQPLCREHHMHKTRGEIAQRLAAREPQACVHGTPTRDVAGGRVRCRECEEAAEAQAGAYRAAV